MRARLDVEALKDLRNERAWTQEDLAAASGLNRRTVQRAERSGTVSASSIRSLAAALEVEVDLLLSTEPGERESRSNVSGKGGLYVISWFIGALLGAGVRYVHLMLVGASVNEASLWPGIIVGSCIGGFLGFLWDSRRDDIQLGLGSD